MTISKLMSLDDAIAQCEQWRRDGSTIVFTNGCFDLLHPGHLSYLNDAKSLGARLVIGLNSDDSIRRLKGPKRPIMSETDRATMVSGLSRVDMVVMFKEDTPID